MSHQWMSLLLLAAAAVILNELCRVAEARFTRWHN